MPAPGLYLPYFPLASGLLTAKYTRGGPPPPGTRLQRWGGRAEGFLSDSEFRPDRCSQRMAGDRDHTLLELAFAWLAAKSPVASVIAGATTASRFEQTWPPVTGGSRPKRSHKSTPWLRQTPEAQPAAQPAAHLRQGPRCGAVGSTVRWWVGRPRCQGVVATVTCVVPGGGNHSKAVMPSASTRTRAWRSSRTNATAPTSAAGLDGGMVDSLAGSKTNTTDDCAPATCRSDRTSSSRSESRTGP